MPSANSDGLPFLVAFKGRGCALRFHSLNTAAAPRYVQVHDADKIPKDGAIPICSWPVLGTDDTPSSCGGTFDHVFGEKAGEARYLERGFVILFSTTFRTLTFVGKADTSHLIEARFELTK